MRSPKITFIGAGSTVFAKNLIGDLLSYPELAAAKITLFDIDEKRLTESEIIARRINQAVGARAVIEATTDRSKALDGADYAINMIQVGGYKPATVTDFALPSKAGLNQTIADSLGIGGIMRAVRTVPVLLSMAHDMERLCPDVLHLNYVNPMAMNCLGLNRGSKIRTVGLCHSVRHTAGELAADIGVPVEEIDYVVAGVNHVAFYLKFERDGQDLYPLIQQVIDEGRVPDTNRVRYDVFKRFGYFVTESSEHFAEYVPWYIKRDRPDLIEKFNIPLNEYPRRCESQLAEWESMSADLKDASKPIEVRRSVEYGSEIIHSIETGQPRVIYGNVMNRGAISNLPADACVELPILVDRQGLQPTMIGDLPMQLAALMQTQINVQKLTVEGILTGRRDHIHHAALLDPHTAAELDTDQIVRLVDDLLDAHGDFVPANLRRRSDKVA
ncbi:alpha-glucosidase/alpha-galactosidase [uncultured Amaricoccus sp.]|uniref:alpha-glucosidase/alpha-galactosidase n=1 Tax=uncultured Amaricoccus sp. TaxID=339341 RepID=UPI0026375B31|nr:alpha-glucosidase/alpha-galactosidase [uncultured Amaricoccus sp.]